MPVEGLPNPYIHKMCKSCGKWFSLEEGSFTLPAARGPLKSIRVAAAAIADDDHLKKFYCFSCQAAQAKAAKNWWLSVLIVLFLFLAVAVVGQQLGWFENLHLPKLKKISP